jgi:hypothetical protein
MSSPSTAPFAGHDRDIAERSSVAVFADTFVAAWGDAARTQRLRWPLFVHTRRKA